MFCCQAIFFVEYFLSCRYSSFHLFFLCFAVYFLLCSCSTWPLSLFIQYTQTSFYLARLVLLLAICFGCVLLGRPQGHTWSTPGYACPVASRFVPGFPSSYHYLLYDNRVGIRTIRVLLTHAVTGRHRMCKFRYLLD